MQIILGSNHGSCFITKSGHKVCFQLTYRRNCNENKVWLCVVLRGSPGFLDARLSVTMECQPMWDGWGYFSCVAQGWDLFLQGEGKEEKPWECWGVPCFDTNSPGSPWACHKVPSQGQQLAGMLASPLWDGAHPALYRQNSWGKNRAELWESACSCCWVHCHQNTDQLKWKCYSLP